METSSQNKPFPRLALWAGACAIVILLACAASTILGAGGLILASQFSRSGQLTTLLSPNTARIQEVRGWVEVKDTDGDWQPAQAGQQITSGQSIRTAALSGAQLEFNDGSQATLQSDSELQIEALNAKKSFGKRIILLSQTAGESSHKVAKNFNQDSRYEVRTPEGAGQAKGTEFRVIITPEQRTYYTVIEGIVAVTAMDITVMVNPGQATYILAGQPPLTPYMSVTGQGVVTQTGESWTIGGQTFRVSETTLLTGSPQSGDWVIVTGHLDVDGSKIADQISLVRKSPTNEFSLSGTVETIEEAGWLVNGQPVTVDLETEIDAGILAGASVRVKGFVLPGGVLQATRIFLIDAELGQPFEFTGILQAAGEGEESVWEISGVMVTVTAETERPEGLEEGQIVHIEGHIQDDGTWLAKEISLANEEEPGFEFTGTLESKDPWKVSSIVFETRDWTEIDANLKTGDRVHVEGTMDESGTWIATQIERIDEDATSILVMIGTVFSTDPWVISGIPVVIAEDARIDGEIKTGMLVRVMLVLQDDGTWLVTQMEALDSVVWFPGCMDVIATVVSVNGSQVQLLNWPLIQLDENVQIEGDQALTALTPNSTVRMRVCFSDDMIIRITYIFIIDVSTDEPPVDDDEGGKVTVCHKPNKNKHTLTISRSALPAHLGHGDTIGACR